MELNENKVKYLLNGQNLNKLNDESFDKIMNVAMTQVCDKSDVEGNYRDKNASYFVLPPVVLYHLSLYHFLRINLIYDLIYKEHI